MVTRSATGGFGRDWRSALDDVLMGAESDTVAAKASVLYAGVAQRCISLAIVVTAQFVLFDGLRGLLAVSQADLSVVLDVFEDRAPARSLPPPPPPPHPHLYPHPPPAHPLDAHPSRERTSARPATSNTLSRVGVTRGCAATAAQGWSFTKGGTRSPGRGSTRSTTSTQTCCYRSA